MPGTVLGAEKIFMLMNKIQSRSYSGEVLVIEGDRRCDMAEVMC